MADNLQISNPTGGLDQEKDYSYVDQNDYTDAKNIRHITKDGNTTGDAQTVYGNERVWEAYTDLDMRVEAQNKQVRISVNATTATTPKVTFYTSPNGLAYIAGGTFDIDVGNSPGALDNLVTYLDSVWTGFGYGNVVEISRQITNLNFASVVVELGVNGTYKGIDFIVEFDLPQAAVTEIVKEAIPITYAGENVGIGSVDILSLLFTFWTTRTTLPDTRDVIGATNAAPIVITENSAHGLVDGDEVVIQGVQFNTNANGKYIVNVVSPTTYQLVGSTGNATPTVAISGITAQIGTGYAVILTGSPHGLVVGDRVFISGVTGTTTANGLHTVVAIYDTTTFVIDVEAIGGYTGGGTSFRVSGSVHNAFGYGEIWYASKNLGTNEWDAFPLLRSKEFNFSTLKQIDCVGEINSGRTEIYFTDDYNFPRVFYYTGEYVIDGALAVDGVGPGIYTYGTIATQLMLVQAAPNVEMSGTQLQAGGQLSSGNWRYLGRFSTDNVNFTLLTDPTGPMNVYAADIGIAGGIRGDASGTITTKINVINVTGIPAYYNYIELIGVHYTGGGVEVFSIKRERLNGITGEITIYHYGNETQTTTIDASILFETQPDIATALNILALDQRLLLANTTAIEHPNLSDWALAATFSVKRNTLESLGSTRPIVGYGGEPIYGEYQDPLNVEYRVGYMRNETYRFAAQLRYKGTDIKTPPYFLADVAMNTANGLSDFSITTLSIPTNPPSNATSPYPYVIYPEFTGFDFDYVLPNGKSIRDEFDQIEIVRAERVPTILASGYAFPQYFDAGTYWFTAACTVTGGGGYFLTPAATYNGGAPGISRRLLYTIFPDVLLGNTSLEFQAGDQILNYGNPSYQILRSIAIVGGNADPVSAEMYGDTTVIDATVEAVDINQVVFSAGTSAFTLGGVNVAPIVFGTLSEVATYPSYYISVNTGLTDVNGVGDYGVYDVQYYRPLVDQYGATETTDYIYTGAKYDINIDSDASDVFIVLGGDVFTQKTTFAYSYSISAANTYGSFFGMYSQNVTNAQMRQMGNDGSNQVVLPRGNDPDDDWDTRITETGSSINREQRSYDTGYNHWWLLSFERGFDAEQLQNTDYPTRIWYSQVKPANSLLDAYRQFLPLQYKDLPTSYGEILSLQAINGELYTWQPRAFMRQYFNARATIEGGDDVSQIIIGSTTVFSVDGRVISTRGTYHKWSVLKGRSAPGHDTAYWIDSELKNAMKFDSAGTGTISEIRNMKAFFANNLRWASQYITPADNFGIHGVWNERCAEVLWTVRANAVSVTEEWDVTADYQYGEIVKYASTPLYLQNFEQTGTLYMYRNVQSGSHNPPTNTATWELIPHTNPLYFNEYTISYCELKNKWESFYSFKPTIYFRWTDTILSTRPLANRGFVYEHDMRFVCRWYEYFDPEGFILTGVVTKAVNTYTVTGVGTAFTTELQVGFEIIDTAFSPGHRYVIRSIESNTSLTIDDNYIVDYGLPNERVLSNAFTSDLEFTRYYPCQIEDAYLTPVVNLQPNVSKVFDAQQYNILEVPYRVDFTTNEQVSFLETAEFKYRENYYYSPIKKESTVTGVNDQNTSRMLGSWMLNKITMRYLIFNRIFNFVTKVRYNRRTFNK